MIAAAVQSIIPPLGDAAPVIFFIVPLYFCISINDFVCYYYYYYYYYDHYHYWYNHYDNCSMYYYHY